jgi:hypothetical protein
VVTHIVLFTKAWTIRKCLLPASNIKLPSSCTKWSHGQPSISIVLINKKYCNNYFLPWRQAETLVLDFISKGQTRNFSIVTFAYLVHILELFKSCFKIVWIWITINEFQIQKWTLQSISFVAQIFWCSDILNYQCDSRT